MVFLAEGGIGALGLNVPSLIAQLINFTILFLVLGWAFRRFLFPLLDERRHRIQEGLDASDEAKRRLSETEKDVAGGLGKGGGVTAGGDARGGAPPLRRGGVRDRPRGRQGATLVRGAVPGRGGLLRPGDGGRDAGGGHLHSHKDRGG